MIVGTVGLPPNIVTLWNLGHYANDIYAPLFSGFAYCFVHCFLVAGFHDCA